MAKRQKVDGKPTKTTESHEEIENDSYSELSGDDQESSDEEASDDEEMGSEAGEEDEFDVDDVSSGDESPSEDEDEEEGDNFPMKKKKTKTDDGSEAFSLAVNAILGSKLKAYDRNEPILARNKKTLKKLESDKLEAKAKRALLAEKRATYEKHRVKNLLPSGDDAGKVLEKERRLKKIAQRGVVRLFNAVMATQIQTELEIRSELAGHARKEELMNEISKEKFLDLVQAAGED